MVLQSRKQRCRCPLLGLQPIQQRTNLHPPHPLPLSDSSAFQNCSSAKQDSLMADLVAALSARETAVGRETLENKAQAWRQYTKWCKQSGLGHNLFLDGLSRLHKIEVMGAFAVAIHQGRFSRQNDAPLAESTVADTLNLVAVTFRENGCKDPQKNGRE